MLVLTRARDEEIRIGDEVVVRVLDVKGDRVRIGIEAPAEISVHRQEVYEEIARANRESVKVESSGLANAAALLRGGTRKDNAPKKNTEVTHGA